ncbi:MAG: MOSC domain-containing protein, partial [Beijerinckiaceae bacterium]
LTMLPPRSCLFFAGGVTLRIDGLNVPCRYSGRAIAAHFPDRENLDLAFVKAARRARGLVAWVEKPGVVHYGETVEVRVPEQWTYSPA